MGPRPISAKDLIQKNTLSATVLDKPKFLSKLEREKLGTIRNLQLQTKQQNARKKVALHHQDDDDDEEEYKMPSLKQRKVPNAKKGGPKFKFGWDEELEETDIIEPLLDEAPTTVQPLIQQNEKHWSEKTIEEMTLRDWRIFKEDYSITSRGGNIANPLRRWNESEIPKEIQDLLTKTLKYTTPTPIQRAAIPVALKMRDILGIAETGSGKTLAYLIPLLTYLFHIEKNYIEFEHRQDSNYNKALGLILAPTRELALQISQEAQKIGNKLGFNVVTIIGGHKYEETVHSVKDGVHVIVATPGRLVDSIERKIISLSRCYYFILDEVDRMIDMGFEKPLQTILDNLPSNEQLTLTIDLRIFNITKKMTLMFTATMSPTVEILTKKYLDSPAILSIGGSGEAMDNIEQKFEYTGAPAANEDFDSARFSRMMTVIENHLVEVKDYSIIVFANFKRVCDTLSEEITRKGHKNVVIHGSKTQEARERTINQFKAHESRILIATDVAARGLDVPNVSLVINFQMVNKFEEYIHRIGRTGRAGKKGSSFTFLDDSNADLFNDLRKFLVRGRKKVPEWLTKQTQTALLKN